MPSTTQDGGWGFGSQAPGAELSVIRLLEVPNSYNLFYTNTEHSVSVLVR